MDFIDIAKYIFIGSMAIFTLLAFTGMTIRDPRTLKGLYGIQTVVTFTMLFVGYLILFMNKGEMKYIILLICEFALLFVTLIVYDLVYPRASRLLVNNMVMLEAIGFLMLGRIEYDDVVRQFILGAIGTVITFFVPAFLRNVKQIRDWGWGFIIVGFILLLAVLFATKTLGANISLRLGPITLQPSEFVKIIFILGIASLLNKSRTLKRILWVTVIAAAYVLVLVVSKDLGTALIFFVAYLMMIFVATKNPLVLGGGIGLGIAGGFIGSKLFSHVRTRIAAWKDPFADYFGGGFQTARGMFSIAAGGLVGVGFSKGLPKSIVFAEEDMIFAVICEEFGIIFGILLILICLCNLLLMMRIASRCNTLFYRLVAVGLGSAYAFQVFLTIGGSTKLIPLTGVTLPFISAGGSSLISSLIIFALINGMYTMRNE